MTQVADPVGVAGLVDAADVEAAAAAALGVRATLLDWRSQPVAPELRLHGITEDVLRITGTTLVGEFSLILKAIRRGGAETSDGLWGSGDDPGHRNYWKREWLAYSSGLLGSLPPGLRAPRCYLVTEPQPDSCWVWMEDVEGTAGPRWGTDAYATAAGDLGQVHGALLAEGMPDHEWLSRRWLRGWVDACTTSADLVADDSAWGDPRLVTMAGLRAGVGEIWQAREALLDIVESAPQTLFHGDLWPDNLLLDTEGRTVAVDWSQVGIGGIAQDLDQLTLDPVWMQVLPDADLDLLERTVLSAYAEGLRSTGADLDRRDLARWYSAAAAVRYAPLAGLQALAVRDADEVRRRERRWRRSFADITADRARVVERAISLGRAALA